MMASDSVVCRLAFRMGWTARRQAATLAALVLFQAGGASVAAWELEHVQRIGAAPVRHGRSFDGCLIRGTDVVVCHLCSETGKYVASVFRGDRPIARTELLEPGPGEGAGDMGSRIALNSGGGTGWVLTGKDSLRIAPIKWDGSTLAVSRPWTDIDIGGDRPLNLRLLESRGRGIVLYGRRRRVDGGLSASVQAMVFEEGASFSRATVQTGTQVFGACVRQGEISLIAVTRESGEDPIPGCRMQLFRGADAGGLAGGLTGDPLVCRGFRPHLLYPFPVRDSDDLWVIGEGPSSEAGLALHDYRRREGSWEPGGILQGGICGVTAFGCDGAGVICGLCPSVYGTKALCGRDGAWDMSDVSDTFPRPNRVIGGTVMVGKRGTVWTLTGEEDEHSSKGTLSVVLRRWKVEALPAGGAPRPGPPAAEPR